MNILVNIHDSIEAVQALYQNARMTQIFDNKSDETTARILDAAWERLSHYGLGKTTMAEIASDCDMSAANLYRYFANKNDIAGACCMRALEQTCDKLRDVVRSENLSAKEKLKRYAITLVEMNFERAAGKSKIGELVANMTENNTDFIYQKVSRHHSLIAEILSQGNAANEFEVHDVLYTAEVIHAGLVVFDVPLFASLFPIEKYRSTAEEVVNLFVEGLSKR